MDEQYRDMYTGNDHGEKLVDWKNPPKLVDLKNDYREAISYHKIHVNNVNRWLEYLKSDTKITIKHGRSKVQPKLIKKQVNWLIPSLETPFFSSPDMFDVLPTTAQDVESAKQNAIILNKQFRVDIPRVKFINKYVSSAVKTGTTIVRLGWEEETGMVRVEEQVPTFAQSPEEAMGVLQQQGVGEEEAQQVLMSGQPIQTGTKPQVTERETLLINRPTIEVRDSRDVIIDPTCEGDIEKASFVIDTFTTDLSSLKKDGRYKNLELVDPSRYDYDVLEHTNYKKDNGNTFRYQDKARKKMIVYEYWGYWDIDDDGITEAIVASWIGDTLIRLELNPFPDKKIPFVVVPFLLSDDFDSVYGEPLAELIKDNQDILGAVQRGMIDIFGCTANGQIGVSKNALDPVNMEKFYKGDNYLFNPQNVPPDQLFFMTKYPDIPQSVFQMIDYQSGEAESQSGVKSFTGGITGQALGDSVGGIKSALDATSKRELSILRRLSDGLVRIGEKIVSMNSVFLSDEEIIRNTDEEHITIKRDDLAGKFDLSISVSTAEEDYQAGQNIAFLLQTLGNNASPDVVKMILVKLMDLYKLPDLSKALAEYQPQPDPFAEQMKALELKHKEAIIMNEMAKAKENEADIGLKQAKTEQAMQDAGLKKSSKDKLDLDFLNNATGLQQNRDLEIVNQKNLQKQSNEEMPMDMEMGMF